MWKKGIWVLIFMLNSLIARGLNLDVALFYGDELTSVKIEAASGKYRLKGDYELLGHYTPGTQFTLRAGGAQVKVYQEDSLRGTYQAVAFRGEAFMNSFHIDPVTSGPGKRTYDDDIKITVKDGFLQIINHVSLEHYIAGVVQSEVGGSSENVEFYQVQAIICRTYALNNHRKHIEEGFNLCDNVHCQSYKGRASNSDILMAVARTSGEVIVDEKKQMISASFHSNCGGQTMNSEDVWSISTSYLKSIRDTFCKDMPHARWIRKMPRKKWLNYLRENYNYDTQKPGALDSVLAFNQKNRKQYLVSDIPLEKIRDDLGLRSTFFEITTESDSVVFHGRGYGHGVGMCQEGAIKMAQLDYTYHDIIHFYYQNVQIVNYHKLPYLIEEFKETSSKSAF